jgi:hypothetical protein
MKRLSIFLLFLVTLPVSAQPAPSNLKPLYHQFDFWLGQWDVYKYSTDTLVGKSHIESIIDSVGLLENYRVTEGSYTGKSISKYNPAEKRWEQYWVDSAGLTLFMTGKLTDHKMVMNDAMHGEAQKVLNQIVWEPMENGSVRQTWSVSKDGGKNWTVVFDGEYRKRKP